MDDLSQELRDAGVGCNIGNHFINHLCYADDMVLLSPSLKGLKKLVATCEQYASEHDIVYNTRKTVCMLFKPSRLNFDINPTLKMCGEELKFVQQFSYLGHVIVPNLSDDLDISRQYRSLCARANMLKRQFYACSQEVKTRLFQAYCTSLYTSQLWTEYTNSSLSKFTVCYNNAFRCIVGYPRSCSASGMFVSNRTGSFGELRRKLIYSFFPTSA